MGTNKRIAHSSKVGLYFLNSKVFHPCCCIVLKIFSYRHNINLVKQLISTFKQLTLLLESIIWQYCLYFVQVWHYCDLNGGQASFLCPNGTIFSQVALTCDWWFNVKCAATAQQYVLNERLYKYILPVKPSFPEDYAGPLVDEYLTLKFQELEAKKQNTTTTERTTNTLQVLLNDEINQSDKWNSWTVMFTNACCQKCLRDKLLIWS